MNLKSQHSELDIMLTFGAEPMTKNQFNLCIMQQVHHLQDKKNSYHDTSKVGQWEWTSGCRLDRGERRYRMYPSVRNNVTIMRYFQGGAHQT